MEKMVMLYNMIVELLILARTATKTGKQNRIKYEYKDVFIILKKKVENWE